LNILFSILSQFLIQLELQCRQETQRGF